MNANAKTAFSDHVAAYGTTSAFPDSTEPLLASYIPPATIPAPCVSPTPKFQRGIPEAPLSIFKGRLGLCPQMVIRYADPATGEIITSYPCGATTCPRCVIRKARLIAKAIWASQPTHSFLITLVGVSIEQINANMTKFWKILRRLCPTLQYTFSIEEYSSGSGYHIHGYLYADGDGIAAAMEQFNASSQKAGMGMASVRALPSRTNPSYFGYPFKTLVDPPAREHYIDINRTLGGKIKLVKASPDFWRDGAGGERMTRAALESLVEKRYWNRNESQPEGVVSGVSTAHGEAPQLRSKPLNLQSR